MGETSNGEINMTAGPEPSLLRLRKPDVYNPDEPKQTDPEGSSTRSQDEPLYLPILNRIPKSSKAVLKRVTFGVLLLSYFMFLIYGGPICILLTSIAVQIKCFDEIITIGYKNYGINNNSKFRYIPLYFLMSANIYFGGETIIVYFNPFIKTVGVLKLFATYHRFISFCVYFAGVIWFVLSLKKKQYRKQFALLAWTHVILLIVVVQCYLLTKTVFQGMIWFIICIATVTCNDIMAYFIGKLIGKTPLIAVSPKKTREGFLGAALATVLITCFISYFLCGNQYFVCPIEYKEINDEIVRVVECVPDDLFQLQLYNIKGFQFEMYPFIFHSFWLAVFSSLVAPFGGFFASGFKRAFKVKDFGDTIPGHGGIMDRFDCQLVMLTFVNVYITTFVGTGGSGQDQINSIFERVMNMQGNDQLELYYLLKGNLLSNGYDV